MTFRQHMRQQTVSTLGQLTDGPASAVYAVTFRVDSVDQDPRFPYLAVGCPTEDEPARLLARPDAPDPWEARWHYACFPPSGLEGIRILGNDAEHDPHGAALHRREAEADGLWYEDDAPPDQVQDERGALLDTRFRELCVEPARLLHTEGDLVRALGRPVPVLLYDMFAPEAMFTLARAANPPGPVADFLAGD
ncbi:hypothetical protein ACFYMO_15845 [Streptomyces sp. NPDC007025]|uniref:hypothetical protein n=1 Tax=Streptomyces sp. NPDC007025 TaxID=3364771 RepID=UPI0036787ECC